MNRIKSIDDVMVILDRITDGFIVLDENFCYQYVNARIGELVQRDPQSLIGRNVWDEFPEAVGSLTYKAFQTAFREQRFISITDYYPPLDLWQENYIYPSPEGLSIFIRDVSEKKRLEKLIKDKERDQQFEIMISTLEAQEKERNYIGQELHDNVNQLLVASRLMLSVMRDNPDNMSQTMLVKSIDYIERAIAENRRISHGLITPDLKEDSLEEQLRMLVQNMLTQNGIDVIISISVDDEKMLDRHQKLALYRIAQEQCINILKHSHANQVVIELKLSDDICYLSISDNGKGVDLSEKTNGIGIRNMEARVSVFRGSLHVASYPGNGFILEVRMPVENGREMRVGGG